MDAQTINKQTDLLALVEAMTELKPSGRYYIGPCPFCGGRDRFNLKRTNDGWRWYCRGCGGGKYHTAIDFIMRRDNCDFKTALSTLSLSIPGGQSDRPVARATPRRPERKPEPLTAPSDDWQRMAWSIVDSANDALLGPGGDQGREYLAARGIGLPMAYAWNLGYSAGVYDPKAGRRRPALVIPWYDATRGEYLITAIKYRFVDDVPGGLRYVSQSGSQFWLYGLHYAISGGTLLIIEGEINALSVAQVCQTLTVLSIGGETNGRPDILRWLARRYRRIWLWSDNPEKTTNQRAALGLGVDRLIKSPEIRGHKIDANDMLQRGVLADFLAARLSVNCA